MADMSDDDHFGPDCPQCQAAARACEAMGHFAGWMEARIADGTFERLGAAYAALREEAFWRAFEGRPPLTEQEQRDRIAAALRGDK